jgi:DNA repair protein RadD
VFVPTVYDAIELSTKTPNAAAVYGTMDKKERARIISQFRKGLIRVIYNVNVLSVGFDHPQLDAIICGRPTASLAWYYQALGRLTRIHPEKIDGLIIDFSGNVNRFGKIESLYYKKQGVLWKLFGENGRLLTGCPLHEIGKYTESTEVIKEKAKTEPILSFGKHRGKRIDQVWLEDKDYLLWMLREFTWKSNNMHIKTEIERLHQPTTLAHG